MGFKSANRAVLLAGLETSYGEGAASFQGILADKGVEITPNAERIERNIIRASLTPVAPRVGAKQFALRFDLEMKGGGLDSGVLQEPEVDPLLQACGMQRETGYVLELTGVSGTFQVGETVNNTTALNAVGEVLDVDGTRLYIRAGQNKPAANDSIQGADSGATAMVNAAYDSFVYRPMSDTPNMASAAVRFWRDGIDHLLTGVRGTFELDLTLSQIPKFTFSLTGIFNDPTDTPEPSVTFADVKPPVCLGVNLYVGGASTQDVISANSVQVRIGNEVRAIGDLKAPEGRKGFFIVDRSPDGSIDPFVQDLADFDPWEDWKTAGAQKISAEVGSGPGNNIKILVPEAVYNEISYQERDSFLAYNLPFTCTGDEDDELWLIFW